MRKQHHAYRILSSPRCWARVECLLQRPDACRTTSPRSCTAPFENQAADAEALSQWWQALWMIRPDRIWLAVQSSKATECAPGHAARQQRNGHSCVNQSAPGSSQRLGFRAAPAAQWIENDQDVEPRQPAAELGWTMTSARTVGSMRLQASWELDLFGATRGRTQGAGQDVAFGSG